MTTRTVEAADDRRLVTGAVRPVPRWIWVPLAVYGAARAFSFLVMAWASQFQVPTRRVVGSPTETYFVHHPLPADPGYLGVVTNWDGQWYRYIAEAGYVPASVDPSAAAGWAWAFPPGYPTLVSTVMRLTGVEFPLAATLLSTLLGALAMVLLYRLVAAHAGTLNAFAAVLATSCFITAPLLQSAYSEALALVLLVSTLLLLTRGRLWWAIVPALLLGLTRHVTPPLAVVAAAVMYARWRAAPSETSRKEWLGLLSFTAVSTLGVFVWPAASSALGGGAGADRVELMASSVPVGWFSAFFGWSPWAVVIPLLLTVLLARAVWLKRGEWGVALSAWALTYPFFLLVVTPPLLGVLRYLLLAFPLGMLLTGSRSWSPRDRTALMMVGCLVLLALQAVWIRYSLVYGHTPVMP